MFTVKLWQKFTHPRMYQAATRGAVAVSLADVDTFKRSLEPLAARGRLGAVLAQFPPSLVNDDRGRHTLRAVITHFGEYGLAVELRRAYAPRNANDLKKALQLPFVDFPVSLLQG